MKRSFALVAMLVAPVGSGAVRADACTPRAQLEGDPAVVESVAVELVKLGVSVGVASGASDVRAAVGACKTVVAAVEQARDGGLAIAVKTGTRSEGRTVTDAVVAASWIDSWVDSPGGTFALPLAASPGAHAEIATRFEPASADPLGVSIAAALDQAWSFDGRRWTGISGSACVARGAWCLGARVRHATQDVFVGQTAATRADFAALATASYSAHAGRAELMPELGLGAGRMTTDRVNGCRHVVCDPRQAGCVDPPPELSCVANDPARAYVLALPDHLHAASVTPRASAALRVAVAIVDHLHLDAVAVVTVAPFGHGAYALPAGEPPPPGIAADQLALPGQSIGTFELGLGLRWGSR